MTRKSHEWVSLFWVLCVIVGCHARVWAVQPGDVVFHTNFGTEAERADGEPRMDQRLWKSEGIGQMLHQGGTGILEPHSPLHIGFD